MYMYIVFGYEYNTTKRVVKNHFKQYITLRALFVLDPLHYCHKQRTNWVSFLSARILNPSHSWRVHHTHRALLCRLCSLTPHTPGPTGLFLSATLLNPSHSWKVCHTHRALLCRLHSLTPHTLGEFTTPTGLFCVGYVP